LADCIRSKYWDCASFLKKHGGVASSVEEKSTSGVVEAAAKADEKEVLAQIQQGHDLNAVDSEGRSGMYQTAKFVFSTSKFDRDFPIVAFRSVVKF
jgi:hypothetical protein